MPMRGCPLLVALWLLLAAGPAAAQMLPGLTRIAPPPTSPEVGREDRAYGAYQAGHYVRAFKLATQRIEANAQDAAAMTLLGELISQGLGTRQDLRRAAEWYELAARRGDANAMFALAMLRLEGRGVARDEASARAWLGEAAARGHGPAAFNLALTHLARGEAGLGEAVRLLRVAAEREVGDAQHALAVLMLEGRGLAQDGEAGADMMARAAQNGSLAGEVEFAILQFTGRGIGRDERAAARGFARAAARGNAIAQNRLARLLVQGRWLPRDVPQAMGWHLLARAQGLADGVLEAELERLSAEDRARAERFAEDVATASALTKPTLAAQSEPATFRP
jgi:hypothetical protein